jgi:plastocyanin
MRRLEALGVCLGSLLVGLLPGGSTGRAAGTASGVAVSGTIANMDDQPAVVYLEPADASKPVPPAVHLILSQKGKKFTPAFAVAVVGQTLDVPNDDTVTHNAFSLSPAKTFDLGLYPKGTVKSVVLDTAGVIDIFCAIHAEMHARILVVATRYFAIAAPDGTFKVSGVPAGSYVVNVWHPDRPAQPQDLAVGGGPVTLSLSLASP